MMAQQDTVNIAMDALKQSPYIAGILAVIVLFLRHLSERSKADAEERKETREVLNKLADANTQIAIVIEGLKEKIKK